MSPEKQDEAQAENGYQPNDDPNMVSNFLRDHQATEDFGKLPKIVDENVLSVSESKYSATAPKASVDTVVSTLFSTGVDEDIERIVNQEPAKKNLSIWDRMGGKPNTTGPNGGKAKNRFPTLARMIKTNRQWTKNMQEKITAGDEFSVNTRDPSGLQTLTFDASHYKVKDRSYGGLTARSRRILIKHPLNRTEEELVVLREVVERLKCFMKYPASVKIDMARVIFYENFDDGRVIIQQGHEGQSLYFVVSGKVDVTTSKLDKITGNKITQVLGELTEGSMFGELALLHNIKRTATVVCKGDSEFLRVDKQDFEAVLRSSYEKEWNLRLQALGWLEAFSDWTNLDIASLNNSCRLTEYQRDKIIWGDTNETSDNLYFVISGECQLVRKVYLIKHIMNFNRAKYHLPTDSQLAEFRAFKNLGDRRAGANKMHMMEKRYWTIGNMSKGFYFGFGEDLTDTYVISRSPVEVLEVPRIQFKVGRARIMEKMRNELQTALPSNKQVYRVYYDECNWSQYKKGVTAEVTQRKRAPNSTTMADVPLAIKNDRHYSLTDDKPYGQRTRLSPAKFI